MKQDLVLYVKPVLSLSTVIIHLEYWHKIFRVEEVSDTYLMLYPASVSSNGDIAWLIPRIFHSSCVLDVTIFPWDEQTCYLHFGSWVYDGTKLDIYNRTAEIDTSSYTPHGEYELLKTEVERDVTIYNCCPQPYPSIIYRIFLQRKPLYYQVNVIFPNLMISATALLMFLVPPESGEKLSLAITLFLSSTVFQLVVSDHLPVQSDVVPALGDNFSYFLHNLVDRLLIYTCR